MSRTKQIHVVLTEWEFLEVQSKAQESHLSVSSYARMQLLGGGVVSNLRTVVLPVREKDTAPSGSTVGEVEEEGEIEGEESLRELCVRADESGDRRQKVAALIKVYDTWWPEEQYKFTRLTPQRAKEWLRKADESATDIYDFLVEGGVAGKVLDRPAVYASKALDRMTAGVNTWSQKEPQSTSALDEFNKQLEQGGYARVSYDDVMAFANSRRRLHDQ